MRVGLSKYGILKSVEDKKRFIQVCYRAGMANWIKHKDRVIQQVLQEYEIKEKISPYTLRNMYKSAILETYNVSVNEYHDIALQANLMQNIEKKHFDLVGELNFRQIYDEFKSEPWMVKWRNAKVFAMYLKRKKLDKLIISLNNENSSLSS